MALWCVSAAAAVPASQHVFVLVLENHSYESVIGNPTMPYLNMLAKRYGLATQYYANSHYSIPNYMWLAAGAVVTTNDNTTARFDVDNIVRHLQVAGKTWKEYAEGLPYAGYVGYNVGNYVERHNPFPYFMDVANSSEKYNIVPFTELAADIAARTLPNYAFITPNLVDDAHNGTLSSSDKWLQAHLPVLLNSPEFQSDGILFITFDESVDSDCRPAPSCPPLPESKGGGRVATIVIGPKVKPGYRSTHFYQHPSVLKTMALALGLTTFPGAAATAADMSEFFQGTTVGGVFVHSPLAGTSVGSPVHISASASSDNAAHPVVTMEVYIDHVLAYSGAGSSMDSTIPVGAGSHRLVVTAHDSGGQLYQSTEYFSAN